jgi:hypothetical protein
VPENKISKVAAKQHLIIAKSLSFELQAERKS